MRPHVEPYHLRLLHPLLQPQSRGSTVAIISRQVRYSKCSRSSGVQASHLAIKNHHLRLPLVEAGLGRAELRSCRLLRLLGRLPRPLLRLCRPVPVIRSVAFKTADRSGIVAVYSARGPGLCVTTQTCTSVFTRPDTSQHECSRQARSRSGAARWALYSGESAPSALPFAFIVFSDATDASPDTETRAACSPCISRSCSGCW